jgi:hypothetical protein
MDSNLPATDSGTTTPNIIGTPDQDVQQWDGIQTGAEDCAIRAQQFILEQFTGQKFSETQLEQEAQQHGWFDPTTGTPPQDVGNELALHGIPVNQYQSATVYQLADELAQGHKVMIGVDSSELWYNTPTGQADHVVVVSGIDVTDPNNPQVIVSDPGTGAAEAHYPMSQFLQAWEGSDFYMVATQQAPPPSVEGMANFDYTTGHIPQVAGMPYDQFQSLQNQPDALTNLLDQANAGQPSLTPQDMLHDVNPSVYADPNDLYQLSPSGDVTDHASGSTPSPSDPTASDPGHFGGADHWDLGAHHDAHLSPDHDASHDADHDVI